MFVQAYDLGTPARSSSLNATVNIIVYRNRFTPSPSQNTAYEVEVPETRTPLSNVQIVSFNDADTDVSML